MCGQAAGLAVNSSAIRAACANERSCGSLRGATSNGRPYRDLINPDFGEQVAAVAEGYVLFPSAL